MKIKIYNFLVNRHLGIKQRYHTFHDKARGVKKALSWIYLLWLNFAFYVLCCRFLGRVSQLEPYENKKLIINKSESNQYRQEFGISVDELVSKLKEYEYISFDIFDTLVFRPFSNPTDFFYLLGEKLGFMDFKRIRIESEWQARQNFKAKKGCYEVKLEDIWFVLANKTGLDMENGMNVELDLETKLCYANPFMKQVFDKLVSLGKHIMIISDMYIPGDKMKKILEACGYTGEKELYVSCDYYKSKASGDLYAHIKEQLGLKEDTEKKWIHVGDNKHSDIENARKNGISTFYYPNVNGKSHKYRPYDMSPIIGGAYRGIVNNYIYCGLADYSKEYEYGYIYGGLFVLGYCHFIHDYCIKNGIDKVLFLARDGEILKQAYEYMYPGESTEYVYWSRRVATKLMSKYNRYDFYRRFIHHKVNKKISISKALKTMELEGMVNILPTNLQPEMELTNANAYMLEGFLESNWNKVQELYENEEKAARQYYKNMLDGIDKACAVDIGWAGSGAIAISYLVEKAWGLGCKITGIVAGTNTMHNAEPDTSETFLLNERLVSYLYSQAHNRDLLKKHNPNIDYNVYWELLLSSPTKQFKGFLLNEKTCEIEFSFGEEDYNKQGIIDIQKGIMDFIKNYTEHFYEYPYMTNISGRDAYAPMLVAASKNERYLKSIEKKFKLEVNIS